MSNCIHRGDVKHDLQREAIVVDRMLKLMDDGASALSSMIQVIQHILTSTSQYTSQQNIITFHHQFPQPESQRHKVQQQVQSKEQPNAEQEGRSLRDAAVYTKEKVSSKAMKNRLPKNLNSSFTELIKLRQ